MDEELYEEVEVEVAGRRWHWSYLTMRALQFGSNVAHATSSFLRDVADDVSMHANYQMERDEIDEFIADVDLELESLLDGPQEG